MIHATMPHPDVLEIQNANCCAWLIFRTGGDITGVLYTSPPPHPPPTHNRRSLASAECGYYSVSGFAYDFILHNIILRALGCRICHEGRPCTVLFGFGFSANGLDRVTDNRLYTHTHTHYTTTLYYYNT